MLHSPIPMVASIRQLICIPYMECLLIIYQFYFNFCFEISFDCFSMLLVRLETFDNFIFECSFLNFGKLICERIILGQEYVDSVQVNSRHVLRFLLLELNLLIFCKLSGSWKLVKLHWGNAVFRF